MSDFFTCLLSVGRCLFLSAWVVLLASDLRGEDQTLDILVVYTPALASYYGGEDGVEALVQSSLISSNEAFSNSGISLKLRLVGLQRVDYNEAAEEMEIDLDHLRKRDGVIDEVLDWREDTGADLVYLFRSDTYSIDHIGIAYQLSETSGSPSFGFGVVSGQNVLSGLVLQHEIGHNLGAAHDPDNTDGPGLYSYSYGHRFGSSDSPEYYRSVMAYSPGVEVNYFSGPDVTFDSFATGTEEADNARTLRQSAAVVVGYRGRLPLTPLAHAGPDQQVDDLDNDGEAQVLLDGSRSHSVDDIVSWEWTWDGGSAAGENALVELPVGNHEVLLTVTNQSGRSTIDAVSITVERFSAISRIFARKGRLFILRENGSLYAAGNNRDGALGIKSDDYSLSQFQRVPLDDVVEIVTSEYHTLFLLGSGAVYASGSNPNGAFGAGPDVPFGVLEKVFDGGIVSIATAFAHSLFVSEDGRVLASGSAWAGRFGMPSGDFHYTPIEIYPSGAVKAAAGNDFSAILKKDGSIWLAGEILRYAKPELLSNEFAKFHQLAADGFVDIAAGAGHLVALGADGSVWTTGSAGSGQLATGESEGEQYGFFKVLDTGAEVIEAGPFSTFVRLQDGSFVGAGDFLPTQFEPFTEDQHGFVTLFKRRAVELSAGADFGAALLKDGSVWGMGNNQFGQFGLGPDADAKLSFSKVSPTTNPLFENFAPTPVGRVSGFAIDFDGDGFASVRFDSSDSFDDWAIESYQWTWPDGSSDEPNPELLLPVGSVPISLTVTDDSGVSSSQDLTIEVKPASPVASVLALKNRILIVKEDGSLWGVGYNGYNAFGIDSDRTRLETFEPLFEEGVVQVAGGEHHTLVLLEDGSLWAGGSNTEGQLGLGDVRGPEPLQQIWPNGVVGIAAGAFHSLFVLGDGRAMAMGSNYDGQTGFAIGVGQIRTPGVLYPSGVVQGLASERASSVFLEDGSVYITDRWSAGGLRELVASGVDRLLSMGSEALFYRTTEGEVAVRSYDSGTIQVGDYYFGERSSPLDIFGTSLAQVSANGVDVVMVDEEGRSFGTNMKRSDNRALALREDEFDEHFSGQVVAVSCSSTHRVFMLEDGSVWAAETGLGRYEGYLSEFSDSAPLIKLVEGSSLRVNEPPVAEVRNSEPVYDVFKQGGVAVLLDGSLSGDDRAIKEWEWRWDGNVAYGRLSVNTFPLGDTEVVLRVTDYDGASDTEVFTVSVRDDQAVAALSGGVAILENGQAYSMRREETGIYGYPQTYLWSSPHVARLSVDGLVSIEESAERFIVVDDAGGAWVAGKNDRGELGLGFKQYSVSSPRRVFQSGVVDSAIGRESLYLVFEDGSLWSTEYRAEDAQSSNGGSSLKAWSRNRASGVVQVATYGNLVIYLEEDGSVWAYGYNSLGALGPYRHFEFISPEEPYQLISGGVEQVYASHGRILLVKKDGSLWGMGSGWGDALGGKEDYVDRFVPISAGPVRKAASRNKLVVWLLEDGSLWGMGAWFEQYDGIHQLRSRPIQASPLLFGDVQDFTFAGSQVIALRNDGKLYVAENGDYDQLLPREERVGPYWKPLNNKSEQKGPLPPVANAGDDVEIYISRESARVILDGSLSTDDWAISKWSWKVGDLVYNSKFAGPWLSAGSYVAELTVEDENGNVSTDTMNLNVVSGSEIQTSLQRYFSKAEIDAMEDPENLDYDGDSFSNQDELRLGTNPNDYDSRAKLTVSNKDREPLLFIRGAIKTWALSIEYSFDLKEWHELEAGRLSEVQHGLELPGEFSLPVFFRFGPLVD
ncbi:M12 family metallo-peptidase [Pelagicoccus mobilis]|uniref:Peptidase M12B domain-containing protein n=1 Tax=Pelagicoccus mobilis TaxID=415221 RepID=A0A934VP59_9BACT|nr:M12 family metallo-peptidase [Pelagicoccus mobilis]MBK1880641.1 hypothetical protein [Pelagicoccus mobilis]